MRVFLACLALATVVATSALAIDLVTNAQVEIVDGITFNQTTALNFGVLALNNGSVIVAAPDAAVTDVNNLMVDNTDVSQGIFSVVGTAGADLSVDCAVGAMPTGITLGTFTADWADAGAAVPVPADRTLAAATEALEIGATITVDRATASTTGGTPANLPYTISVTYQ